MAKVFLTSHQSDHWEMKERERERKRDVQLEHCSIFCAERSLDKQNAYIILFRDWSKLRYNTRSYIGLSCAIEWARRTES